MVSYVPGRRRGSAVLRHLAVVESPSSQAVAGYLSSIACGAHADDLRLFRCERLEMRLKWSPTDGHQTSRGVAVATEQQVADFVRHDVPEPAMKGRELLYSRLADAVGEDTRRSWRGSIGSTC